MADLGAAVVKVETAAGDPMRSILLPFDSAYRKEGRKISTFFECVNSGKLSLRLDIKRERAAMLELLSGADVIVTNMRLHQLKAVGLDYTDLRESHPHLVFAHVTAWGRSGPAADLPTLLSA